MRFGTRSVARYASGLLYGIGAALIMPGHWMTGPAYAAQTAQTCGEHAKRGCIGEAEHFAPRGTAVPGPLRQRRMAPVSPAPVPSPVIGLAFAGGGTRASHFSIGVLKGLHEANVLNHVDFLSTVSGGGYAGYWYVSQRLAGAAQEDLFRDCIPNTYEAQAQKIAQRKLLTCTAEDAAANRLCLCPKNNSNVIDAGKDNAAATRFSDPFRYQNHLRGHTDIFAPSFSYASTRKDERLISNVALPVAGQVATSLTVDFVGDMLFDWNLNGSPSRFVYREGIRRIYGLPPLDCARYLQHAPDAAQARTRECIERRSLVDQADIQQGEYPLPGFAELRRELERAQPRIPYWIINATTPVLNCPKADSTGPCVVREFMSNSPYPPHKAAFEFTPTHWGAGEFGYWPVDDKTPTFGANQFPLLEAVASSAAFFDPHEKSLTYGGALNVLQQSTGFKWGYYLPNPHVSTAARVFHRTLVFPLYFAHRFRETKDAVDVHVIDGGQSDNLGAYGLIRRRVPNIILSDHASETNPGNMEDVCALRRSFNLKEFWLENGRKIWHIHFDGLAKLDQVCRDGLPPAGKGEARYVYNVWEWTHPVLQGCAVEIPLDEYQSFPVDNSLSCRTLKEKFAPADASRFLNLFLIKPAFELARLDAPVEQRQADTPALAERAQASRIEIRGYLQSAAGEYCRGKEIMLFPTHSTINLTLDSSAWVYGAYRELAAGAARQLTVSGDQLTLAAPTAPPMQPVTVGDMERRAAELTRAFEARAAQP